MQPTFENELEVLITLWPSLSEIKIDDKGNDPYLGGLTSFYASFDELEKELAQNGIFMQWHKNLHIEPWADGPLDRDMPPPIVEFIVWLGTAGLIPSLGVTLYKVLDLWIKKANGRKITVRFGGGFEIETTQLTEKQFETLLQKILEFKEKAGQVDTAQHFPGYQIKDESSLVKEESHIHYLQVKVQEEMAKRIPGPGENLGANQKES